MIAKYVNQPLGMGNPYSPTEKRWILSAIGAVGSIASSIFGGASAAKSAREAEKRQRLSEAKEDAWYNRKYNEDYADTAAGQNLVRRAKEYARDNWRKARGAQAVAGGTDASAQMAKDAGNKMMGDTLANIAATDQQRKENADNQHQQAEERFAQMDMNREMQRAQNITNAAQQASNALMSVGSAIDQASAAKQSLTGGSNNGTSVEKSVETGITSTEPIDNSVSQANSQYGGGDIGEKEYEHFRNTVGG